MFPHISLVNSDAPKVVLRASQNLEGPPIFAPNPEGEDFLASGLFQAQYTQMVFFQPVIRVYINTVFPKEEDFGVRVPGPDGLFSAWIQVYNPCFKIDVFHSFTC